MGERDKARTLRVATLNIYGHQGGWDERRPVLIDGFRNLNADITAFQEAVVQDGYDQVADILGHGYHVHHQPGRSADGVGASIASRWPIAVLDEAFLHVSGRMVPGQDWIGSVTVARVTPPQFREPLLFVHYKPSWQRPFEHEREVQAVAAARMIEERLADPGGHVVVAGDFDAAPDSASIRFWCGKQSLGGDGAFYEDAWDVLHPEQPGLTVTRTNVLKASGEEPLESGRRIDYILVRGDDHGPTLEVTACERLFDRLVEGVWGSDHFGVWADLAEPGAA